MKYFEVFETFDNKFMVSPNLDNLPVNCSKGSYNILAARVMGLSYANYLRMCRDLYNGEINGKGSLYPIVKFVNKSDATKLISTLNSRTNEILK